MNLLLWIIFGGIAGWLASVIVGSDYNHGMLIDIVLGIIGAMVGGFVFNFFGQPGVTGFNFYSMAVAVIGSIIIIFIGRALRSA